MTLRDIADSFSIDINRLYKELNLDKNVVVETTMMKELYKFNPSLTEEEVREVVAKIINFKKQDSKEKEKISVDDIKGSMTLKEVIETFNLNKKEFYYKLNIDDSYKETLTLKEIKELKIKEGIDFEVEDIRNIVRDMIK